MISQAIFDLITSNSGYAALAGTRLYPLLLPDNYILPAATYQVVSSIETVTLDGKASVRSRYQIDCMGATFGAASALRSAIITAANGYTGTVNGTYITLITKISHSDHFDHDGLMYRCMVELFVLAPLQ